MPNKGFVKINNLKTLGQRHFLEMAAIPPQKRKIYIFCIAQKWFLVIRRHRTLFFLLSKEGFLRSFNSLPSAMGLLDAAGACEYVVNTSLRNSKTQLILDRGAEFDRWVIAQICSIIPNAIDRDHSEEIDLVAVASRITTAMDHIGQPGE